MLLRKKEPAGEGARARPYSFNKRTQDSEILIFFFPTRQSKKIESSKRLFSRVFHQTLLQPLAREKKERKKEIKNEPRDEIAYKIQIENGYA